MPFNARSRSPRTRATRRALVAWFTVVLSSSVCAAANRCPDEGCVQVRPQDRVILISSRPVGCATDPSHLETGLYAEQYVDTNGDGLREWTAMPWRSLIETTNPTQPMIAYTHGNRVAWSETRRRGMYVYKRLLRCATDERPVQYLIFAWNSSELDRPLRDYRVKAARTAPVGKQLAYVLGALPEGVRLGAMGYSYGARVTSGALEELGSGRVGSSLRSVRAFYIAAALDAHWLARGRRHGNAMDLTEQLLLTTNGQDPAMKFYHLLYRNYDPQALGGVGPTCLDRERRSRVRCVRVERYVGRSHDLCDYVRVPGLMSKAYRLLSYQDQPDYDAPVATTAGQQSRGHLAAVR